MHYVIVQVKWSDSDEGYGQHVFEYNHGGDSDDYSDSSYKSRKPKQLNSAQFAATPAPHAQPNQRVPFPDNNKQDYSASKTRAPSAYGQPVQRSVTTASPIKLKPIETSAASKLLIQPKFTAPSFIKYERGFESQAAKRGVIAKRIPTFLVDNNP